MKNTEGTAQADWICTESEAEEMGRYVEIESRVCTCGLGVDECVSEGEKGGDSEEMGPPDGTDGEAQAANRAAGVGVKRLRGVRQIDDRPHVEVLINSKYLFSHDTI